MGQIRGLTLWRPWPNAFLLQERSWSTQTIRPKRVENRDWYPQWACQPMSGGVADAKPGIYFALHAGHRADLQALDEIRRWGWPELRVGEPSLIVAVCRFVRVLDLDQLGEDHPLVARHLPWVAGRYLWEVDQVVVLPDPVSCSGAQGLWLLPDPVLSAVREQWATGRAAT